MSITGIWPNSKLKELFIESKNSWIEVRTRNIWPSKVEVQQGPRYYANPMQYCARGLQKARNCVASMLQCVGAF